MRRHPLLLFMKGSGNVDTVNIVSEFTRKILSKLAGQLLRKHLGCEIGVQLNSINVTICDGKAHIHLDADAEIEKEELQRLIKNQFGLDEKDME